MRLLLLLLLSITNIFAQEKVLGVDIPKDFIVDYNESKNLHYIYSSNLKEYQEEFQKKGVLEDNYLTTAIEIVGNANVSLVIFNNFWEDSKYQDKLKEFTTTMIYIKNNDKILKKEMKTYLTGGSGLSVLAMGENPLHNLDLSFIIDNLNENSTLRIEDFADNVFEYKGEELKSLLDTIKLYKQLKKAI